MKIAKQDLSKPTADANINDELRWDNFRAGDANALTAMIQTYYADVFRYGCCFTPDSELVKDCIQDIALKLWKNRQQLNHTSNIKFYLMKALRRRLQEVLLKNKRYIFGKDICFEQTEPADSSSQEVMMQNELLKGLVEKVREALNRLPSRQREIIYLRFYAGLEIESITSLMQLKKQSTYNLLHTAIENLKASCGVKSNHHLRVMSFFLF